MRTLKTLCRKRLSGSAAVVPLMPALRRPRQSIWKDTPTPEQLADLDNIYALVWRTNSAMLELGLTDATVGHYRNEGLAIILNRHYESGTDRFSGEILDQIVAEKRIQYEYGQIGRGSYQKLAQGCVLDTGDAPDRSYYFGEGSKLGGNGNLLSRSTHF